MKVYYLKWTRGCLLRGRSGALITNRFFEGSIGFREVTIVDSRKRVECQINNVVCSITLETELNLD